MAGGKGGSTTTSVEVPEYIQEAAKRNLTKAEKISQLGYVPYYGPDVAAFTPLQEAAFGNVAGQAGAFGLQTPAGGVMSGMPAAQEFAGGVRGYSSAPMFEGAIAELAAKRPAQKAYIDSFFIDPVTGQVGTNVAAPIDYSTAYPQVPVAPVDTGDGGGGGGGVDVPFTTGNEIADLGIAPDPQIWAETPENIQQDQILLATDPTNIDYDVAFRNVYDYQSEQAAKDPYGQSTGIGITTDILDRTGGAEAWLPPTQADYNQSTTLTSSPRPMPRPDDTAPVGIVGNNDTGSNTFAQTMANVFTPFDDKKYVGGVLQETGGGDSGGGDSGGGSGNDCVIATHAVSAGGFTPSMKREAVVWCMNVLHDKWWGEAIRRGYRHLGKAKIAEGKAHEHYQEFRDYIAFANGKKRTLKGAFTFAYRTAQFFVVGLVKKDA